jgi:GNAT superfamily N-acetyltransferase
MDFSQKIEKNSELANKNHENLKVSCNVMSQKNMIDLIYKDKSLPQDERFLSIEDGGVFKYFDLEDIFSERYENLPKREFILVQEGGTVAGIAGLRKNPYEKDGWWIGYVTVDPKFQGKGYATRLVDELFKNAAEKGITIETSGYSTSGDQKLRPLFHKYSEKYQVPFTDREGVCFPD